MSARGCQTTEPELVPVVPAGASSTVCSPEGEPMGRTLPLLLAHVAFSVGVQSFLGETVP